MPAIDRSLALIAGAKLCNIADDLIAEVEHALKYPEEAHGRDNTVLEPLRTRLKEVQAEVAHRAGEPELMKTEAAERMRQKLGMGIGTLH